MSGEVDISIGVLRAGVGVGVDNFLSPEGIEIANRSNELASGGDVQAFFVPVVRLIVDAALKILNNPEVSPQLPLEIVSRQITVTHITNHITKLLVDKELFSKLYAASPLGDSPTMLEEVENLANTPYLSTLAGAPFSDARQVCGGALRFLEQPAAEARLTVARSRGLLAVSGIYKGYQDQAYKFLGSPYVDERHLELRSNEDGSNERVVFTRKTQQQLAAWSPAGRGCPASRIQDPSSSAPSTLLENYWLQLVDYLVPLDATVNGLEH
jgi:hypothetical protein